MKNLFIFLFIAYAAFSSSLCLGQKLPINEKGLTFQYDGSRYIGSRYDEYCKSTFDIYKVKGTVINSNKEIAAHISAFLYFDGDICNKIYGENGPIGGEIIDQVYVLNIPLQSEPKSRYWVNRLVQLLPEDKITAEGTVEVKKGEPCPEPRFSFSYELVDSKGNVPDSKTEEAVSEDSNVGTNSIKPTNGSNNWSQIIVGEWKTTSEIFLFTNGKEKVSSEPPESLLFKNDGNGVYIGRNDEFKYAIQGNKIVWLTSDGSEYVWDIVKLDTSTFIMKYDYEDKDETGLASIVVTYSKTKK